jgi:hypothetical protein
MPTKKKIKKKLPIGRIVFLALLTLLVIALTTFLTMSFYRGQQDQQLLHEQKVRLDAAEKDLNSIAGELLTNMQSEEVHKETYIKDCGESSTKFGRGTITCGPFFSIKVYTLRSVQDLVVYEDALKLAVGKSTSFTDKKRPYFREATTTDPRTHSVRSNYNYSASTECYFRTDLYTPKLFDDEYSYRGGVSDGKNVAVISAGCNEVTKEPIYKLTH